MPAVLASSSPGREVLFVRVRTRQGQQQAGGNPWQGRASAHTRVYIHTRAHTHIRKVYLCRCGHVYRCVHVGGPVHMHGTCRYMQTHMCTQTGHMLAHTHTSNYTGAGVHTHRRASTSPVREGPLGPSADREGCARPPGIRAALGRHQLCALHPVHPHAHPGTLRQMLQPLFPWPVLVGSGEVCGLFLRHAGGKVRQGLGRARDSQDRRARQVGVQLEGTSLGSLFSPPDSSQLGSF